MPKATPKASSRSSAKKPSLRRTAVIPAIALAPAAPAKADTAVFGVYADGKPEFAGANAALRAYLAHVRAGDKGFKAAAGEIRAYTLPKGCGFTRAMVIGLGKAATFDSLAAEKAGGQMIAALNSDRGERAAVFLPKAKGAVIAHMALGARLRGYVFRKYKTGAVAKPSGIQALTFVTKDAAARKIFTDLEHVASGMFFARDAVNEPPNVLYPESFAQKIRSELAPLGIKVEILDDKRMKALGMGAAIAVGQGSARLPRMVVMRWDGAKNTKSKPIALVGKGVTFDSGGISIKPAQGMEEMKMDMGGAAAVVGALKIIALNRVKTSVVGIVGLAENMLSGEAYRPADIVTSHAGKTIEVLNTDAEGRLVLADALSYVQKIYKPGTIIDLATLTGAMIVALGDRYCGTFANDDGLWKGLERASRATGEVLWRMPLDEAWRKEMESPVADLQNTAKSGRNAGACTAAGFLEHFIEKNVKWAHLDIAGVAWVKSDRPTAPRYGTGFGARLLAEFVTHHARA